MSGIPENLPAEWLRVGSWAFPALSGLAFSQDPYVWCDTLHAEAGATWLAVGLGGRFRDTRLDDYARLFSLADPARRPEGDLTQRIRCAQRQVDVLNAATGRPETVAFTDLAEALPAPLLRWVAEIEVSPASGKNYFFPTFEALAQAEDFWGLLKTLLAQHRAREAAPFALAWEAGLGPAGEWIIKPGECQPLPDETPRDPGARLAAGCGPMLGLPFSEPVAWMAWIEPLAYGQLPMRARHELARRVGQLNRKLQELPAAGARVLIAPGRLAGSSEELGLPVKFAEISAFNVLLEVPFIREDLHPEASRAAHFLPDLIRTHARYAVLPVAAFAGLARHPELQRLPNRLADFLPEAAAWEPMLHLWNLADLPAARWLGWQANPWKQQTGFFWDCASPGGCIP